MLINEEELRTEIVGKLREWVSVVPDPDKPIIGTLGNMGEEGETLSPKDILDQVQRKTAIGDEFVKHWIRLAVEHIMNSSLLREKSNEQTGDIRTGFARSGGSGR